MSSLTTRVFEVIVEVRLYVTPARKKLSSFGFSLFLFRVATQVRFACSLQNENSPQ